MGESDDERIQVKDVSYSYGGKYSALENVSFKANFDNGVFSILGPNGAGKTTLVNLMTTSMKLQNGSIEILGYDVKRDRKKIRSMISLCPQELELDVLLSINANLWSYGLIRGMKKELLRKRIDELLETFLLLEKRDKKIMELSGGEMRRVQLMRALLDPTTKIIFIDEPTLGLDPIGKKKTWEIIKEMTKMGYLFVLTTNDMVEVESLSHEILFLNMGRVILQTTVEEFKKLYAGRKKLHIKKNSYIEEWVKNNENKAQWYEDDVIEIMDASTLYEFFVYMFEKRIPIGEFVVEDESMLDGFINLIEGKKYERT